MENFSRSQWLVVALALTLGACGPEKNEDTAGGTGSSGSTDGMAMSTGAAGATTTTMPEPTGGTGSGSASAGTSAGTTGADVLCGEVPPDAEQMCSVHTDRASCNGAALDPTIGGCAWVPWFTVRLINGMCMFGEPRGQCLFIPCAQSGEGCQEPQACGSFDLGGGSLMGMNQVSVGLGPWCTDPPPPAMGCVFDDEGQLVDGAPECVCLCDPGFPGAP